MKEQNQKGIASLLAIIIVIAVGAIAIGGVLAYQYYWTPEEEVEEEGEAPKDETAEKIRIKLYYYNIIKDKEIADYIPCSPDAVLPVDREIPVTITPIQDTIRLLLEGKLTSEEVDQGFRPESNFPLPGFKLVGANLKDGVLTLEFADPNHSTIGGSCRVGLLASSIIKTAKQFPEVEQVKFEPRDSLFQP